jgi:hypothetical protein
LPLLHKGPLLVDHILGIRSGEFLDMGTFGLRKAMAQPGDLGHGIGFLLDRLAGCLLFLPNGDNHERQQNGVDHAQSCVDEACDVVVGLARFSGNEALHQLQPGECYEADPAEHEYAIHYGK